MVAHVADGFPSGLAPDESAVALYVLPPNTSPLVRIEFKETDGDTITRFGPAATLQWSFGHLPLTAAIAAMGAAMVSLVDHAHDARTPAATAWVICAGAAVMLTVTMLVAASLPAWSDDRGLYRPLAGTCVAAALACLGLGAARPAPLILGLVLVVLLTIPWCVAVVRRYAVPAPDPVT